MKLTRTFAASTVAATAVVALGAPALAAPPTPSTFAQVVGTVKIDPTDPSVAYVLARYRCTVADPETDPAHLCVSVKQNQQGTVDPAISAPESGWGGTAYAWEDSHRNPVTCDGKTHTQRFTVDQVEGKDAWASLSKGQAWVQFCLFDDTTPKGDGQTDFGEPVSSMVWAFVH